MKEIPLTQGQATQVDDCDYEELSKYKWHAWWCPRTRSFYARRHFQINNKQKTFLMHRVVVGAQIGELSDHRDHNTLNNQRLNLRVCTHAENSYNKKRRVGCSSIYKGVHWQKAASKWKAYIGVNGHQQHLGFFNDEIAAAHAYDVKASELFGEFAFLNFP